MGLFNIFKKKEPEKEKEKEVKQPPEVKVAEKPKKEQKLKPESKPEKKPEKAKKSSIAKAVESKTGVLDIAHCVLKEPHISEKSTDLVEKDQYTFKVWPRANKNEIKKSIEDIYSVDVIGVKIIKVPRRKRRMGRITGWKSGYKKAIVRIKKGQKIEVLPR